MKGYFNNSMKQVLSHFSNADQMDIREADELIQMLEEIKNINTDKKEYFHCFRYSKYY